MSFRVHLTVAAALALSSCGAVGDTKAVEAAVGQFHSQLDAGSFEAIYAAASPALRKVTPKDHFIAFLGAVHRKLGASRSTSNQGWSVFSGLRGTTTRAAFATKFERGTAEESFVFESVGNRPVLSGYSINSDALVLN